VVVRKVRRQRLAQLVETPAQRLPGCPIDNLLTVQMRSLCRLPFPLTLCALRKGNYFVAIVVFVSPLQMPGLLSAASSRPGLVTFLGWPAPGTVPDLHQAVLCAVSHGRRANLGCPTAACAPFYQRLNLAAMAASAWADPGQGTGQSERRWRQSRCKTAQVLTLKPWADRQIQ
jgi:hypothetical protein